MAVAFSGDPAAGEAAFRQCTTCHTVTNPAGEMLAGRGLAVGPNLYGVAGRPAGEVEGFKYSASMAAAGAAGLVWTEDQFVSYAGNPTAFLREYLADPRARGAMTHQVRREQESFDVYAYLATLAQ
ncbi:c-type cytochrome [Rhodovulum strictum]|uniref:C-type cytochrome n=2 Tax=Rhodovulum strictum TaxID=58314 RepID=A0A844BEA9_9RHOB|nr:c-type cytochrome [Rhodovulum strictum]